MENQRDEKGRFMEGHTFGMETRFQPSESGGKAVESGRKGGIASGESKRANQKVAEIVRRVLAEPSDKNEGKTKMDDFVEKVIKSVFGGEVELSDLEKLQRILGEDMKKIEIHNDDFAAAARETLKKVFGDNGEQ